MDAILTEASWVKSYLFLQLKIVTVKSGSTFLILLYHLERFGYVTTVFWLHEENKTYKSR